ncbi:hypothetical protein HJFPF1_05392 [Paramyrothecium foliicola]|nr:hypothetical protein HJFPF1_05392 [Paramyrothecium foliicola]
MTPPQKRINLLRGWPSPDLLPAAHLSAAAQRVLADPAVYTPILEYGPSAGHPALRVGLAAWLGRHYGVEPDWRGVCVSGGASQSIGSVMQTFTDPAYTRAVWLVAPCYHLVCDIFADAGFEGRMRAVPEDDEGIDIEALRSKIVALEEQQRRGEQFREKPYKSPGPSRKFYRHVIYAVPTCSNPSGKTMSLRRREQLVELAREHDALIICDDVYDLLQWPLEGPAGRLRDAPSTMRLPRLCDIDLAMGQAASDPRGFGYAISNGSFSKMAGPGVRTGWVAASPAFVVGLGSNGCTQSGGAPSQLSAAILADLVESGALETFVDETVRPALQRRHRRMMEAIHEHIAPLGVKLRGSALAGAGVYGGYFVWFTPTQGLPSKLISDRALEEENMIIGYGNMFEVHGDEVSAKFNDEIRLCFAWEAEDDLVDGVQRLGRLLKRMQENRGYYESLSTKPHEDSFTHAFK